jgi:hypothetical protein
MSRKSDSWRDFIFVSFAEGSFSATPLSINRDMDLVW